MEDRCTPRTNCVERPKGLADTAASPHEGRSHRGRVPAREPPPPPPHASSTPSQSGEAVPPASRGGGRRPAAALPHEEPPLPRHVLQALPGPCTRERFPVGGLPPRRGPAAREGPRAQPGPGPQAPEAEPRIGAGGDGKRRRAGGAGRGGGRGGARGCAVSSARGAVRAAGRAEAAGAEPGRPGPDGLAESSHGAARGRGPSFCARPGRRVAGRGRRAAAEGAAPAPARPQAARPAMVTHAAAARRDHG